MEITNDIAQSFLEETDIKNNRKVLLVMAYGSRITHNSRKNSDLDILVVIDNDCGYRAEMMIDGVHLDISIMTLDRIIEDINLGRANGNMYVESV